MPIATAHQTIGPYWHLLDDPTWANLTRFGAEGEHIVVTGRITDGGGAAVGDACVEIWQSDPPVSDAFSGFGRAGTDADGMFRFVTLKPGPVRGRGNAVQAPHLAVAIFARGLLRHLVTRFYFAGEALNATDPLLSAIEDEARRTTLIARPDGAGAWRLDIRLQGEAETVFLDV
jgi:protocatechuate 3,4-dioxygenase alpha subunit